MKRGARLIKPVLAITIEQQQITLVRRELLFDGSGDDRSRKNTKTFVPLLQEAGIDPTAFAQWQKLTELWLVANVVKHAEGRAAAELERARPDLFVTPSIRGQSHELPQARRVYQPLSGNDLMVTRDDISAYFEATLGFWEQLSRMVRFP